MCVSILRELGGVTDLPRLAERWSALFPRYEVSRDCQVSSVLHISREYFLSSTQYERSSASRLFSNSLTI